VEQFENVCKDEGFDCFLTVKGMVAYGRFCGRTDGDLRWDFAVAVTV